MNNQDNFKAVLGGIVMVGVVVTLPELRAVVAIVGAYLLGFVLVEKLQNAFNKEKTTV